MNNKFILGIDASNKMVFKAKQNGVSTLRMSFDNRNSYKIKKDK